MIRNLLKLVILRGAGVIIYTASAIYALPEENIVASIMALAIIEFLNGMLYPTFKTAVITKRVEIEIIYGISLIICMALLSASYLFYTETLLISFVLYLLIVINFPFIIKCGSLWELKDANKHIKMEVFASLASAIVASIIILGIKFFKFDSEILTPLFRNFGYSLICIVIYFKFGISNIDVKPSFNFGVNTLRSFVGLDYLFLFSILRYKILSLLSMQSSYPGVVKSITLIYDPISSFYGFYLRSTFARVKFDGTEYVKKIRSLFMVTLGLSMISSVIGVSLNNYGVPMIISVVALFLSIAGLTTSYIVVSKVIKIVLISFYVICVIVLYNYEYVNFGFELSLSLFLMATLLMLILIVQKKTVV